MLHRFMERTRFMTTNSRDPISAFVQDTPREIARRSRARQTTTINGVIIEKLGVNGDKRGELIELFTTRDGPQPPVVHVYQVITAPGSLRGWVYHARQEDRLFFTMGNLTLKLADIRRDSSTFGSVMTLHVGATNQVDVVIPAFVAHHLSNDGDTPAAFVNMPTHVYDPGKPDKFRYDGSIDDLFNAQ
jgi:dTDP-4-dehydrorhamnose 3,5-epimerase-like enzyme